MTSMFASCSACIGKSKPLSHQSSLPATPFTPSYPSISPQPPRSLSLSPLLNSQINSSRNPQANPGLSPARYDVVTPDTPASLCLPLHPNHSTQALLRGRLATWASFPWGAGRPHWQMHRRKYRPYRFLRLHHHHQPQPAAASRAHHLFAKGPTQQLMPLDVFTDRPTPSRAVISLSPGAAAKVMMARFCKYHRMHSRVPSTTNSISAWVGLGPA